MTTENALTIDMLLKVVTAIQPKEPLKRPVFIVAHWLPRGVALQREFAGSLEYRMSREDFETLKAKVPVTVVHNPPSIHVAMTGIPVMVELRPPPDLFMLAQYELPFDLSW